MLSDIVVELFAPPTRTSQTIHSLDTEGAGATAALFDKTTASEALSDKGRMATSNSSRNISSDMPSK